MRIIAPLSNSVIAMRNVVTLILHSILVEGLIGEASDPL
jgi:hypothetical protein